MMLFSMTELMMIIDGLCYTTLMGFDGQDRFNDRYR